MATQELLDKWEEFKNDSKIRDGISSRKMKFDYPGGRRSEFREEILDALVFWEFIRAGFIFGSWKTRRIFLQFFISSGNPSLVEVLAMVESMPDSLWLKILDKHNIDFASPESFLRRLGPPQIEAIRLNYGDLMNGEVPRVFNWFDRWILGISSEKLLNEPISWKRYQTQGALSYNLLGLDFGFSKYHFGTRDDTKTEAKTIGQLIASVKWFFAKKNHIDDFVVRLRGKYFWLYRTARSNYVWDSNRMVVLKTHVCPGFWATLIIHSLFWVISPVLFAATCFWLSGGFAWPKLFLLAFSSLTPVWILAAVTKFVFKTVQSAVDGLSNFLEKRRMPRLKKIGHFINKLCEIVIVFILIILSAAAVDWAARIVKSLYSWAGFHWIFWLFLAEFVFCCVKYYRNDEGERIKSNFLIGIFLLFGLMLWEIAYRLKEQIETVFLWMLGLLVAIPHFFVSLWNSWSWAVLAILFPFAIIGLAVALVDAIEKLGEEKSSRIFFWLERIIVWGCVGCLAVSFLFLSCSAGWRAFFPLALVFSSGFAFIWVSYLNPERNRYRKIAKNLTIYSSRFPLEIPYQKLMANSNLDFKSNADRERKDVEDFLYIVRHLYFRDEHKIWTIRRFLPRLNHSIAQELAKIRGTNEFDAWRNLEDYFRQRLVWEMIFKGRPATSSICEIIAREESKRIAWKKARGFMKTVFYPFFLVFVVLFSAIGWLFKKTWEVSFCKRRAGFCCT